MHEIVSTRTSTYKISKYILDITNYSEEKYRDESWTLYNQYKCKVMSKACGIHRGVLVNSENIGDVTTSSHENE